MPSKLARLQQLLKDLDSVLIAFSGGVDSTFLLKVAHDTLGGKVLAVIAESPTFPEGEVRFAAAMCETFGVKWQTVKTNEFTDENFLQNSKDRCYFCKKELFLNLKKIAAQIGLAQVVDGSNYDDKSDYRPGNRAKNELGIRSPLMEVGLTKREIRKLSKEMGLPTWDKPSYACLASRIPYGTRITEGILGKVRDGEGFLRSLGFKQLRVRHHGAIVRIEVDKASIGQAMQQMDKISKKFEELGYTYVTLDLKGYRTGSMNAVLQ